MNDKCKVCHGDGWVCENHPDKAWSKSGCECGAGMPCECNRTAHLLGEAQQSDAELIQKLQKALFYWMPSIAGQGHPYGERAAEDSELLFGLDDDSTECAGDRLWQYIGDVNRANERILDACREIGCPDDCEDAAEWIVTSCRPIAAEAQQMSEPVAWVQEERGTKHVVWRESPSKYEVGTKFYVDALPAAKCRECNGTGTSDGLDGALIPCFSCRSNAPAAAAPMVSEDREAEGGLVDQSWLVMSDEEKFEAWADEYGFHTELLPVHQYALAAARDAWMACSARSQSGEVEREQ